MAAREEREREHARARVPTSSMRQQKRRPTTQREMDRCRTGAGQCSEAHNAEGQNKFSTPHHGSAHTCGCSARMCGFPARAAPSAATPAPALAPCGAPRHECSPPCAGGSGGMPTERCPPCSPTSGASSFPMLPRLAAPAPVTCDHLLRSIQQTSSPRLGSTRRRRNGPLAPEGDRCWFPRNPPYHRLGPPFPPPSPPSPSHTSPPRTQLSHSTGVIRQPGRQCAG